MPSVKKEKNMTLLLFLGTYAELLVRWWKVNLGLAITWLIGLFGDPAMGVIDPHAAAGAKEVVIALATLFTAMVTIYIAWRKGKRELEKIEQETRQERQRHRIKMLNELEGRHLTPANKARMDELTTDIIDDLAENSK